MLILRNPSSPATRKIVEMLFWLVRHHRQWLEQQQIGWQCNESSKQVDTTNAIDGIIDKIDDRIDEIDGINGINKKLMDLNFDGFGELV